MNLISNFNEKKHEPFENIDMISNGFFIFLMLLGLCVPAFTQENTDLFYMCKRERMVRWLKAYKLENGKCQTLYSKEGYVQVVSSATYFSSCEAVMRSVQKNLEEGGFTCGAVEKHAYIELE